MAKKILTGPGLEPETSTIPYHRSSISTIWPFAGMGAPVRSIKPITAVYLLGSRPRFHSIHTTNCCMPVILVPPPWQRLVDYLGPLPSKGLDSSDGRALVQQSRGLRFESWSSQSFLCHFQKLFKSSQSVFPWCI